MSTFATPAGVCRFCGCSEYDACVVDDLVEVRGCSWADASRRVCSVCRPASLAEGLALRTLRTAGHGIDARWLRAFHHGLIVGWFAVSARSRYGRNPYPVPRAVVREAWTLGQHQGMIARLRYQTAFGSITNAPRRSVLDAARGAGYERPAVRALSRRKRSTPAKPLRVGAKQRLALHKRKVARSRQNSR
jgi:hypothetical protein